MFCGELLDIQKLMELHYGPREDDVLLLAHLRMEKQDVNINKEHISKNNIFFALSEKRCLLNEEELISAFIMLSNLWGLLQVYEVNTDEKSS